MQRIDHPFGPLFRPTSKVLILGSFPSVKSREQQFFYGHPQNRFWKVIAALFNVEVPSSIEEKKELILNNDLALWDSIASCEIVGSADSAIRNAKEAMMLHIYGMEEDGEEIPAPTPLHDVAVGANERTVLIDVYMPAVRQAHNNKSVNRTVTLPAWLNAAALERGLNFSQVLQDALKTYVVE